MGQVNGDLGFADDDPFGDALDDSALLFWTKVFPTRVKALDLRQYLVAGEVLNSQEVHLGLKLKRL